MITVDYRFSEVVGVHIPRTPPTDLITSDYRFSEDGVHIPHTPTTGLITADYRFSEEGVRIPHSPTTVLILPYTCYLYNIQHTRLDYYYVAALNF